MSDKPRFLASRSPLVDGGKARLMSARKVKPRPAKPFDPSALTDEAAAGYATEPFLGMRGEPECVGPAIVDGYASIANFHKSQAHALHVAEAQLIRPTLPPESRLSDIKRRAKHSHVNLGREAMIIGAEITRARTGNRHLPARVLRRIENLEGLLDAVG